jgi:hypothetical protein
MGKLPQQTLSVFQAELKRLEAREAILKTELAEVQTAVNYIKRMLKTEKNDASTSINNG